MALCVGEPVFSRPVLPAHEIFDVPAASDLPAAARWLLTHLAGRTVVLLDGEMGAGKTTLVRAIAAELGVSDAVSSPTYGLVHEYRTAGGAPVYHFDLYRLESPAEAAALGLFEYFDSGFLCLIEWPERLGEAGLAALPPPARLTLEVTTATSRRLTLG